MASQVNSGSGEGPTLSVVIPALDEEQCIADSIHRLRAYLDTTGFTWELIVVDDGSEDRTVSIVQGVCSADRRVRLMPGTRQGKGAAVRRGMLAARGAWRFMADADLSMPPDNIGRFFAALANAETSSHVAIGSREAPGARRIGEPWTRHAIGRLFNLAVQAVAVPGIRDTQCGFKLFSAEAVEALFPRLTIDSFAFDVELLFLAQRAGAAVREVGIEWHCRLDSRVSARRGAQAFIDVLRVRWNAWRGRYRGLDQLGRTAPRGPLNHVSSRSARLVAFAFAIVLAAAIACAISGAPLSRCSTRSARFWTRRARRRSAASFEAGFRSAAYLRPLRIAQIKALFDAAGGHYQLAYRGFHVVLLFALLLLFVGALRVESREDLAAAVFALMVLTGMHTFIGFVREAFPINHFLEIAVFCLVALNLVRARGGLVGRCGRLPPPGVRRADTGVRRSRVGRAGERLDRRAARRLRAWRGRRDRAARRLFPAAFRTWRPACRRSANAVRDSSWNDWIPRSCSGGSAIRRHVFYAYNVAASLGSVLFAEPRDGVFVARARVARRRRAPRVYLTVLSSLATTVLIVWTLASRWRASERSDAERMAIVAAAVLAASAVLSFAYTKDEIMAVAGVYYAVAAYAAARLVLEWARRTDAFVAVVCVSMLLAVLASAWAVRSIGVHHVMRVQISRVRNDWAEVPLRFHREERWPTDPRQVALIERLRTEALETPPVNSHPEWNNRWFGD